MEVMTRKEACTYLGISDRTLYSRIKAGMIPVIQAVRGGKTAFLKSDLDGYISRYRKDMAPLPTRRGTYRKRRTGGK